MASAIIHLAVANEINKSLKKDNAKLLIGSIAPDISKLIGETKERSHFLDNEYTDIPNIDKFLDKYKVNLSDDFVMGYYIHLYTDYLWFKYFITEFINKNTIIKLDGTVVKLSGNMGMQYIYSDYTNLNIQVIDKFNLDLKIFYQEIPMINNIIEEISISKIQLLIDKMGTIIANTKERKAFTFDIDNISKFIETSVKIILSSIEELTIQN